MIADQPGDEARVVTRQALLEAERVGVHRTELGMIAAAALGDVVEQGGEIGDFRALDGRHQPRQLRQFVLEARQREPAQVAQYEQDVRVHGVGVEQVVLHAADDATEGGNVAPEHAVQVHAAELVRHAVRRAQQLQEQAVMPRVLPELLVDQPQVTAERADRRGAHAADLRVLLHQPEQFEDRRRVARKRVVRGHLEVIVADLEARVQRYDHRRRVRQDRFAEQLQQHFVQQADVHDRAVVPLHELLDRQRVARVLVTEHLRDADLVVEQQPILAPARQHVQREAHLPEERLRLPQLAQLAGGEEAVAHQFIERLGAEVALGHPANGLDVAQPARARSSRWVRGCSRCRGSDGDATAVRRPSPRRMPVTTRRCPGPSARRMAWNRWSGPASRRASMNVVATLTSAALSRWQSSIVRTL